MMQSVNAACCFSADSMRMRSVTSSMTPTRPPMPPSALLNVALLKTTSRSEPSA
ncbi:MAG: hypothetical protein AW07_01155 [Candidatus Accumulibacter sp. SK-11]|nr:MAG: hypothetical protein AW07_01155 [Candidatus Accumulibacter sp. SK-11]